MKLLAQGERDIVEGKVTPQEDFFASMDCHLEIKWVLAVIDSRRNVEDLLLVRLIEEE